MVTPHGAVPGKTRVQNVDYYNLDVIISVGYRVKSQRKDGTKRIADHTLVALTVMIAESKPQEKEMMVNLVMTFLA